MEVGSPIVLRVLASMDKDMVAKIAEHVGDRRFARLVHSENMNRLLAKYRRLHTELLKQQYSELTRSIDSKRTVKKRKTRRTDKDS